MTKVFLYRVTPGNFGDDLNSFLIPKLIEHPIENTIYLNMSQDYPEVTSDSTVIVPIGTIFNKRLPVKGKKVIVGSGTGYGTVPVIDDSFDIRFVRGPKTASEISRPVQFITDPAILLVDYIKNVQDKTHKFGYMPHHGTANDEWRRLCEELGIIYIDPRLDYLEVLKRLFSCEHLITEAMHGAILADAYRIPWLPISSAEKINEFKWQDWSQSMEISYEPQYLYPLWDSKSNLPIIKKLLYKIRYFLNKRRILKLITSGTFKLTEDKILKEKLEKLRIAFSELNRSLKVG